jgi:hypothetical protein
MSSPNRSAARCPVKAAPQLPPDNPFLSGQILMGLYIFKAPPFKQEGNGAHLPGVRFDKQLASGVEVFRGPSDKGPDKIQPVPAAVQGQAGFPPDFRGQGFNLSAGDIGGVGDDYMETGRNSGKEVAFDKAYPGTGS